MVTIKDALGAKWNTIKLHDDETPHGGILHSNETLGEFMLSVELNPFDNVGRLQKSLKKCGIKQLEIADKYIEELVQQKIWDIEEEFGIDIIDYRWDYK